MRKRCMLSFAVHDQLLYWNFRNHESAAAVADWSLRVPEGAACRWHSAFLNKPRRY